MNQKENQSLNSRGIELVGHLSSIIENEDIVDIIISNAQEFSIVLSNIEKHYNNNLLNRVCIENELKNFSLSLLSKREIESYISYLGILIKKIEILFNEKIHEEKIKILDIILEKIKKALTGIL